MSEDDTDTYTDEARRERDGESSDEPAETRLDPTGWRGRGLTNALGARDTSPLIVPPGQIGSLDGAGGASDGESTDESASTTGDSGGPRVHSIGEDGGVREHGAFHPGDSSGRTDLARLLHGQYGTQRDVYESLGYPSDDELDYQAFLAKYRRHPYASPIVDKPALDTFQDPPTVIDHGRDNHTDSDADGTDPDRENTHRPSIEAPREHGDGGDMSADNESGKQEPVTAFEKGVKRLFDGDTLRRSLLHRLITADRANRLGSYSAIFLGLRDDRSPEERIDMQTLESVREDDAPTSAAEELNLDYGGDGPDTDADDGGENDDATDDELSVDDRLARLSYIAVYDEGHTDFSLVDDHTDHRNRLPEEYQFDPASDADDFKAHYSRVVHIAEGTLTNDLRSDSVLRVLYNNLEDTLRIAGGSAEGLWMGAFPGLVVNPPTIDTPNGKMPAQFEDGGEELAEQIRDWRHSMERAFFPNGGEVDTIDPVVPDPTAHMEIQLSMLSAGASPTIPRKLLVGNQTGDRASKEDRQEYAESIRSRRNNHAGPLLVRSVLDRLITLGVLAEPEGDGYDLEWPAQDEPTAVDQAEIMGDRAEALKDAAEALTSGISPELVYDTLDLSVPPGKADEMFTPPTEDPTSDEPEANDDTDDVPPVSDTGASDTDQDGTTTPASSDEDDAIGAMANG